MCTCAHDGTVPISVTLFPISTNNVLVLTTIYSLHNGIHMDFFTSTYLKTPTIIPEYKQYSLKAHAHQNRMAIEGPLRPLLTFRRFPFSKLIKRKNSLT
uniref:Ovule protein n=1 Tax=Heterorhabditis bacteriophora TaxID=37862 RepID=A0A1I7WMF4_HETBA